MSDVIFLIIAIVVLIIILKNNPILILISAVALISFIIFKSIQKKNKAADERLRQELEEKEKARKAAELKEARRQEYLRKLEMEEKCRKEAEKRANERMIYIQSKKNSFQCKLDKLTVFNITYSEEKHNRNRSIYVECKNVTKSTPLPKIKDFVAVDVETTGLKATGNDIIQLSAVKFINFEPVELFSTYIKPRNHIPEDATDINGITDDMVENAPKFYQIIDSFNNFIEDLPLVAHNAPFDMKHLYANGLDSIENKTVYDTLDLSKKIFKDANSYKLQNICEELNIYFDNAHNSDADSLAAGLLFLELVAERKETTVLNLIETVG